MQVLIITWIISVYSTEKVWFSCYVSPVTRSTLSSQAPSPSSSLDKSLRKNSVTALDFKPFLQLPLSFWHSILRSVGALKAQLSYTLKPGQTRPCHQMLGGEIKKIQGFGISPPWVVSVAYPCSALPSCEVLKAPPGLAGIHPGWTQTLPACWGRRWTGHGRRWSGWQRGPSLGPTAHLGWSKQNQVCANWFIPGQDHKFNGLHQQQEKPWNCFSLYMKVTLSFISM